MVGRAAGRVDARQRPCSSTPRARSATAASSGYEFEEFGDHDADPTMLLDLVTVRADTEMARRYLTRTDSGRWQINRDQDTGDADEVVGRIEQVEPFGPLTLVIDGHAVTWDELGQALSSYEGWQFVLRIAGPAGDPRR